MAESYARPKASNAPYALSKVAQLTCVYRTFFFSLVCRSLPTPLTSAVAAAARSLSEAVSSSYGRSPSQDVIDFYTKMSNVTFLTLNEAEYIWVIDTLTGTTSTLVGPKREQLKARLKVVGQRLRGSVFLMNTAWPAAGCTTLYNAG